MKVFSLEKFIDSCIKDGDGTCANDIISRWSWAVMCNNLTSREIRAMGYITHDDWMVELPDSTVVSTIRRKNEYRKDGKVY